MVFTAGGRKGEGEKKESGMEQLRACKSTVRHKALFIPTPKQK